MPYHNAAMAGKGLKNLNEAMNALSIASKSCRALPVRLPYVQPSCY